MAGIVSGAEGFKKINESGVDLVFLVERLKRIDSGVVSLEHSIRGAVRPQNKRSIAVERADLENIPEFAAEQVKIPAGIVQARAMLDKISMEAIEDIGLAAQGQTFGLELLTVNSSHWFF